MEELELPAISLPQESEIPALDVTGEAPALPAVDEPGLSVPAQAGMGTQGLQVSLPTPHPGQTANQPQYGGEAPNTPVTSGVSRPQSARPLPTLPASLPEAIPSLQAPTSLLSPPEEPYLPSPESRLPETPSPSLPAHIQLPESSGGTPSLPSALPGPQEAPEALGPLLPGPPPSEDLPASTAFQGLPEMSSEPADPSLGILREIAEGIDKLTKQTPASPRPAGPTQLGSLFSRGR